MKLTKRSLSMIVAIILCATMAIGSTLAYLTDTDESINTMVLGNVDIQQNEVFAQNSLLMPAVEQADGSLKNTIQKEVSVTNTGKNDAFVRTVFGFEMGSLSPEEFLEYVGTEFSENVGTEWSAVEEHGMITVSGQNYYMMSTVRNEKLAPRAESGKTLMKVWLDKSVDRKQIEAVDGNGDGELTVIVLTQGVQVEGFADAKTALNEAFQTLFAPDSHPWKNLSLDDINDATYWYDKNPEADVFEIRTAAQLKYFADLVNSGETTFKGKTVALLADIDLAGIAWEPIGNVSGYPGITFAGTFDGQGHTISNMTATAEGDAGYASAGFFGSITGKVKNLTIDNATVISTHYAGGIVGFSSSNVGMEISNCHVKNSKIISKAEQTVEGWDNGDKAGGIIGYMVAGDKVTGCTVSNTTIQAYRDLGGIVGNNAGSVTGCSVKNVALTVDATNNYKNYTENSQFDAGNVIGENSGTASENTATNVNIIYNDKLPEGQIIYKDPTTNEVVVGVTSAEGLKNVETASDKNTNIILMGDVDMGGEDLPSIFAGYAGTIDFDGNGHTISNVSPVTDNCNGMNNQGMFSSQSNTNITIKNITIESSDMTVDGVNNYGSAFLVGYNEGDVTIENVHIKNSTITGGSNFKIGLFVGYSTGDVTIKNCSVEGSKVNGGRYGTVLVGQMNVSKTLNIVNTSIDSNVKDYCGSTIDGAKVVVDGVEQ